MRSFQRGSKRQWALGISIVGILLPEATLAQSTAAVSPLPIETVPNPEADKMAGLEEIVVTAQRREESQQNVPISITTVSAASALRAGVSGTESLGVAVPALQFGRQPVGATPFLRGVGTDAAQPNVESPVAVYVDDVYIGSPQATLFQFNNINSVEVLKGPQGTLFGRNATGGVIHVHTKQPSHDASIDATAGFGSYDTYSGSLYATGGLSDTIAVNIAATGSDQTNGYGRALFSGDDIYKSRNYGVRGQLLWEPGSDTKLLFAADYSRGKSDIGLNPTIAPGTIATGGATFPGRYRSTNDPIDTSRTTNYGFSGKVSQDLGAVSLVSISGYRSSRGFVSLDVDGSLKGAPPILVVANNTTFTHSFSQEVQVLSNAAAPFSWIVGGFYYWAEGAFDPTTFTGLAFASLGGASTTVSRQSLKSYSGFGEASYKLKTGTKLTLGLRYTDDKLHESVLQTTGTGAIRPPSPFEQHDGFSKVTYRAILDQQIGNAAMAYTSYSRGYRSGSYNLNSPTIANGAALIPAPVVSPEVLDAYEIGLKSEFLDRILRLNFSVFYYSYQNLQISVIQNSATITLNAAKARIKGVDADFNFVPTRRLNISGGVSLLDSEFVELPNGPLYVPNPALCSPTPANTGPLTGGNRACSADLSGNRTPRSPTFTGTIAATYTLPTLVGKFAVTGSLYHNSGYFWAPDNRYKQPSYNLLNASLAWVSPSSKYEVRVYAKNLLDEYYFSYFSESTTRDSGSPEMPRNYGMSVTAHF